MTSELILIILMIAGIAYWLNAMRCKEIAREAGKRACTKYDVSFLDDTVVIEKVRLRRNFQGKITIYREYSFEFTSNIDSRYKARLSMLDERVQDIDMGVYRSMDDLD